MHPHEYDEMTGTPDAQPFELLTQAEAAKVLGVSRVISSGLMNSVRGRHEPALASAGLPTSSRACLPGCSSARPQRQPHSGNPSRGEHVGLPIGRIVGGGNPLQEPDRTYKRRVRKDVHVLFRRLR